MLLIISLLGTSLVDLQPQDCRIINDVGIWISDIPLLPSICLMSAIAAALYWRASKLIKHDLALSSKQQ